MAHILTLKYLLKLATVVVGWFLFLFYFIFLILGMLMYSSIHIGALKLKTESIFLYLYGSILCEYKLASTLTLIIFLDEHLNANI